MSLTPKALQDLLDELEASRASRKRAWENLPEIRWVLKDAAGLLVMAASGLGIALIPCFYRACGPPGLVYREIADSTLDLSVGCMPHSWGNEYEYGRFRLASP